MGNIKSQRWKVLTLVFLMSVVFGHTVDSRYTFKNAEDRAICKDMTLEEISPYREVSPVQLSWGSAEACCKMKGRILHTIERSDESAHHPLFQSLTENFRGEGNSRQFWISMTFRDDHFRWTYGTTLLESFNKLMRKEKYVWGGSNVHNTTFRCVGVVIPEVETDPLELHPIQCNTKLKFICQKVPRIVDNSLSGTEMGIIGSAQFLNIPEFPHLKFSKVHARWPVANAICQSRNWALIDRVHHETYGRKLLQAIDKKVFMTGDKMKAIHSSGNDFCEQRKWHWACDEDREIKDAPWLPKNKSTAADKKHKRCLQYQISHEKSEWTVAHVDCNDEAYIICTTKAPCSTEKQYPCLHSDANYINLEEGLVAEAKKCSKILFNESSLEKQGSTYWFSSTKFTWLGAKKCCDSKGWHLPAPKSAQELNYIKARTLSVIPKLCSKDMKCDGFWADATTEEHSIYSSLRFLNGKPLTSSLYGSVRADGFTYPSCGRINYLKLGGTEAIYVHADCLEMNFLVCEQVIKVATYAAPQGRSLSGYNNTLKSKHSFNQTLYKKFLEPPLPKDIMNRQWRRDRNVCPEMYGNRFPIMPNIPQSQNFNQSKENPHIVEFSNQQSYKKACPNSALKITPANKPVIDPTDVAEITVNYQNKVLRETLLTLDMPLDVIKNADKFSNLRQGLHLLSYSTHLYSLSCPIVPQKFLANAFNLFHALYEHLHPDDFSPEIMTKPHFKWTLKLLDYCRNLSKPTHLKQDACGETIVAKHECNNYVCTDSKYESKMYKADLLVDILWKVHAVCFPAFTQNMWLHHKFALSIVDLWESDEIRIRWSNQLEDRKFWVRVLGPHFEWHLVNMERCNAATISSSFFNVRLPRSSVPVTARIGGVDYKSMDFPF